MRTHLVLLAALAALAPGGAGAEEATWIFQPSLYSHSPTSGRQVAQYRRETPAYVRADDTYQESGYRHINSSIQVGNSSDHFHVVQTWGQGELIRPYGEWEYPFRAGATPYGPWGNPQGPWTLPFDSWQNSYGLMQMPRGPWAYGQGSPMGSPMPGAGAGPNPFLPQGGPQPQGQPVPSGSGHGHGGGH
jgi:hypothetical protein